MVMEPEALDPVGALPFHKLVELVQLPSATVTDAQDKRTTFMSLRPAWVPARSLPPDSRLDPVGLNGTPKRVFGGCAYVQAAFAAKLALEGERHAEGGSARPGFELHTINGCFSGPGLDDRPFIYDVSHLSTSRGFCSRLVTARQPRQSSVSRPASGLLEFAHKDGDGPLGAVCFSAICTFKRPETARVDAQGLPPQQRFATILHSRSPTEWAHSPTVDIDAVREAFPDAPPGIFPGVEMRKVDMTAFNKGKPFHEHKELILYRLKAPIPEADPSLHALVHAFVSDRNGLLMAGNNVGIGHKLGQAASMTYSFVLHVNAQEAVLSYGAGEDRDWWIQELCFVRAAVGRATFVSKTWSPQGIHVATAFQDGILREQRAADYKERL